MPWPRATRRRRPVVSIVLATHNRPALLRLALDSALHQTYANLEVLVLDDGSTNETGEVLAGYARRYPPERFRFERHPNMGQARTLNRGYEMARGQILGYLSDDDILAPTLVATLVDALARDADAAAAYPAYRLIDDQGAIVDTWLPLEYTPGRALCRHDTIVGPGGLARRRAIEDSGGWDPEYRWMGDLLLWMGVGLAGPIVRVAEPLASWRKHPEGATSTVGVARAREHLRLFEEGLAMDGDVRASRELRAEALRNACLVAAWFAGHTDFAPGEPVTMVDQDRTHISAWASGQPPDVGSFDERQARNITSRLRTLGSVTLDLAVVRERRSGVQDSRAAPAGYERAVARLQAAGVLSGGEGPKPESVDDSTFGEALLEAALDCGRDVRTVSARFLVPDRRQSSLVAQELEVLVALTMSGPSMGRGLADAVAREIAKRVEDVALAGARKTTTNKR